MKNKTCKKISIKMFTKILLKINIKMATPYITSTMNCRYDKNNNNVRNITL